MVSFLGLDVAKLKFDAALLSGEGRLRHQQFPNTPEGFAQLHQWLEQQGADSLHVCLEATSHYGTALATHLHQRGHVVSVVNPLAVRAFARCELARTKSDRADAGRLARFCQLHRPRPWTPTPESVAVLQTLVKRLESLQQMRQMESNRLDGAAEEIRISITSIVGALEQEMERLEQRLREHLHQDAALKRQHELLISIPGIGASTAAILLAEMPDAPCFDSARQVAAFAGLAPRIYESGSSVRGRSRLCKQGRSRLRRCLYFPAISALRFNPVVKAFGERLSAAGKSKMVVIGAAMRKLLHLAYGVLKSGKPFDPAHATP